MGAPRRAQPDRRPSQRTTEPRRLDIINRELRRLNPDLIALQEVVQTPEREQLDQRGHRDAMGFARAQPILRADGTFETCRWPLSMSAIRGKADLPVEHPNFSV